MIEKIESIQKEASDFEVNSSESREAFRLRFLSRKGLMNDLFEQFKNLPNDQKKEIGVRINQLKTLLQEKYDLSGTASSEQASGADFSKPGFSFPRGSVHPITIVRDKICSIFTRIGYKICEGPEIEDDWHNFSALNFPPEHPARDMQDTFFLDQEYALRTHTSSVQIRVMEQGKPPFRAIAPGRVFRNEAISARAHCQFHQVEGFVVDKHVSFADLKQTLLYFSRELFGEKTNIRLRPSYFPFTEPSAEMDVSCPFCTSGCSICKGTSWVEILGCGMIDPDVLRNCNIDPEVYSGFAFGLGIERITMMLYGVNDLRLFFENDLRFLEQFYSEY